MVPLNTVLLTVPLKVPLKVRLEVLEPVPLKRCRLTFVSILRRKSLLTPSKRHHREQVYRHYPSDTTMGPFAALFLRIISAPKESGREEAFILSIEWRCGKIKIGLI